MNRDWVAGQWKEFRGDVQERWGKLTKNDLSDRGQARPASREAAGTLRVLQGPGGEGPGRMGEGEQAGFESSVERLLAIGY